MLLNQSGLMRCAEISHSYLAMTKESVYSDEPQPLEPRARVRRQVPDRLPDVEEARVVPAARRGAHADHARPHRDRPSATRGIEINTAYSYGLDDQEFVVSFNADEPGEFLDLVQELRGTESSAYTESETPIFTCISAPVERALDALDGESVSALRSVP